MNDTQNTQIRTNTNEISMLDAVRLLLGKFYWLLLSGILAAGIVFVIVNFLITPSYESRVSFYVYNSTDGASHTGTINNNDLQAAESLAATYSKILGSNSVLDAILEDVGAKDLTRKELAKMVDAAVVADTQLLEVVVRSTDPAFACKVANSFVKIAPTEIVRITKAGGVEVVVRPAPPTEKASPRTVFDTAIGFLIGVIICATVIIIRVLSDRKIYLSDDISSIPGVVMLGEIPLIEISNEKYSYWKLMEGGKIRYEDQEGKN